jgi:hypothetical protein
MNKTNVKPFVFVLMPFDPDFDDIYQVGIKAACLSMGAYCERVDEQIFIENILDRVYNQIAKADIIISEMTGRNPNVFYETGYAHALNKPVILLTQSAEHIPFDLKHYPHIVYGKIAHLKTELEKRIKWYIDNPTESITKVDLDFDFIINGETWQDGVEITIPYKAELIESNALMNRGELIETDKLIFSLQIGLHNISNTIIEGNRYHLGIVSSNIFTVEKRSDIDNVTLNGQNLIIRPMLSSRTIFPDAFTSAQINLSIKKQELTSSPIEFTLKLFTELGAKEYKFMVNLVPAQNGG